LDQATQNYGIPWNSNINYGYVTDARDGQVYRTVVIGTQTWMAQNLNYAGANNLLGACYSGVDDNCNKHGRLYLWAAAMDNHVASSSNPSGVRGICPVGWHIPSLAEWYVLMTYIDSPLIAARSLKSTKGWNSSATHWGSGHDVYGFRATPGGYSSTAFYSVNISSGIWSTSKNDTGSVLFMFITNAKDSVTIMADAALIYNVSIRCVKD
jgi:uncharacterized protein (TIGR02145 family)